METRTYGQFVDIAVKQDALLHDKLKAIKSGIRFLLEGLEKEWGIMPELDTMKIIISFNIPSPFDEPNKMTVGMRVDGIEIK